MHSSILGFPGGSAGKEFAYNVRNLGLIPVLGRSPGEGKGYPFQYSELENAMDCIVHGVAKRQIRLSDFHLHFFFTFWAVWWSLCLKCWVMHFKTCHSFIAQMCPDIQQRFLAHQKGKGSKEGTWDMGCFGQICATVTRSVLPECFWGMAVPTKFPVLHVGVCMVEFGR